MTRILCLRIANLVAQPIEALHSLAAHCKQFTPLVGIDPDVFPQSVLLDITHVAHLFGGEAALVERILDELRSEGRQVQDAVAGTPGAAWALAAYGGEGRGKKGEERHGDGKIPASPFPPLPSLLSPLPLEALRLPESIVTLLHSLGVWRIEALEALPRRELLSRFGPELLDCLDRVTGRLPEPLPAWDPPLRFEVRWSAEFPTARREMLDAVLERLVRRLATQLGRAGRGAMRLECRWKCAEGESRQATVGLFRPSAWANHLVELLQAQLESLQLPGPVDAIHLAAISTAPLELRQQEMFCQGRRAGPQHLSALIDRLSNRLGHACVMRVRLVPEAQPELACHYTPLVDTKKAGEQGRKAGCSRSGSVEKQDRKSPSPFLPFSQPRPLRLLAQPIPLPAAIQRQIVRRIGPERIETGWWRGRGVARDYYYVETAAGRCYWVFRRLAAGPWFLHGTFD